ncbi:MAG TPA: T9SS type A sorting domain-containing protein, partial [Lentimicrobium sp.]|nr:T9SS type A sorting domain-containing protein [Lentimicrobium sp.]
GVGFTYQEVAVKDIDAVSNASVSQNYPNPSNGTTQFTVSLDKASLVSVDIYNLLGQKLSSLSQQKYSAGDHTVTLNTSGLNAGVYIYSVTVNGERYTNKMTVK